MRESTPKSSKSSDAPRSSRPVACSWPCGNGGVSVSLRKGRVVAALRVSSDCRKLETPGRSVRTSNFVSAASRVCFSGKFCGQSCHVLLRKLGLHTTSATRCYCTTPTGAGARWHVGEEQQCSPLFDTFVLLWDKTKPIFLLRQNHNLVCLSCAFGGDDIAVIHTRRRG